ncbi:cation/H(+) antiporter [Amycolatopsis sp. WAC 01376]|uniref:cation:proton antiporter n=1 Tax=Amycolatopsis sp. WAC 01376 TaxID=2203195 RepID=UPI000F780202|nr:cation:proton antiporter [Amycolatopsis sp. WAC 01376]RSM56164.1 cation/H(+) antiporter [Amycolatopsis sp. WAC 01376]
MPSPVAPIGAHSMLLFLLQLGLLLGLALALGRLALRLKMPAVVGELTAGVLIGPSVLSHLAPGLSAWLLPPEAAQLNLLDAVGQLGVLLLVGITGLHMDLKLVRRKGKPAAWTSAGGLLVPLGLGIGLGFALPDSLVPAGIDRAVFALFMGVAMGVSAIPVIAKTLLEMRLLHRDIGQLIVSAAAVDDIIGWLLLSVVSALAVTGLVAGQVALLVGGLLVVLVLTVVVGRPLVNASLRLAARSSEPGPGIATVVVLLLLAAAGTHAVGMEPVLGTLLCGILIGSSRHIDLARLAPLRTIVLAVLTPIYFATAGLRMDLTALRDPAVLGSAVLVLVIAVVGKFTGAYLGARAGRLSHWEGLALGSGLNARGVIQVIVAIVGLRLGVLSTATYTIIVLVAIVTSLMAPPTLRYAVRRIAVTDEERVREKRFHVQ